MRVVFFFLLLSTTFLPDRIFGLSLFQRKVSEKEVAEEARQDLSRVLGVNPRVISIVEVKKAKWSDTSLGYKTKGEIYAQVETSGFVVILEAGGTQFRYHADKMGGLKLIPEEKGLSGEEIKKEAKKRYKMGVTLQGVPYFVALGTRSETLLLSTEPMGEEYALVGSEAAQLSKALKEMGVSERRKGEITVKIWGERTKVGWSIRKVPKVRVVRYEIFQEEEDFWIKRKRMVEDQIEARGIKDKRVLRAMRKVKRHLFVPSGQRPYAYEDRPLPIGEGQTISQPYIVALMTELLQLEGEEKVLEIGTGSGYQAAILGELAKEVYTIEIIEPLAIRAKKLLRDLGYKNIEVKCGDGYLGWPDHAPFDGIIVTCAPPHIPHPLIEQLSEGGRLVIPVGETFQELKLLIKEGGKIVEKGIIPVRFVPMTGEYVR